MRGGVCGAPYGPPGIPRVTRPARIRPFARCTNHSAELVVPTPLRPRFGTVGVDGGDITLPRSPRQGRRGRPTRPLTFRIAGPTVLAMTTSRPRPLALFLLLAVVTVTGVTTISPASAADGEMRWGLHVTLAAK